jgi:hypothetical protein
LGTNHINIIMATWYATNDNDGYSTFGRLKRIWWTLWIMRKSEWQGTKTKKDGDNPYEQACAEILYRDPNATIIIFARRTRK